MAAAARVWAAVAAGGWGGSRRRRPQGREPEEEQGGSGRRPPAARDRGATQIWSIRGDWTRGGVGGQLGERKEAVDGSRERRDGATWGGEGGGRCGEEEGAALCREEEWVASEEWGGGGATPVQKEVGPSEEDGLGGKRGVRGGGLGGAGKREGRRRSMGMGGEGSGEFIRWQKRVIISEVER